MERVREVFRLGAVVPCLDWAFLAFVNAARFHSALLPERARVGSRTPLLISCPPSPILVAFTTCRPVSEPGFDEDGVNAERTYWEPSVASSGLSSPEMVKLKVYMEKRFSG